jgi:hypothetical protein
MLSGDCADRADVPSGGSIQYEDGNDTNRLRIDPALRLTPQGADIS